MPVSVATTKDPFRGQAQQLVPGLRVPQARVLAALMPSDPNDPPSEWPFLTRVALANKTGVSPISDSVWRALHGLRAGRKDAHPGLVRLGMVGVVVLDVEGVAENNYRITAAGIRAIKAYLTDHTIPPVKDRSRCVNAGSK